MQHHRRVEEHRGERLDGVRVDEDGVVRTRCQAKAILLQAYLECLDGVCHSKPKDSGSTPRLRKELVKLLTSRKNPVGCSEAFRFCLEMWDDLSSALSESKDVCVWLPKKEDLAHMREREVMLRLALLADFYWYQKEVLDFDGRVCTAKLCKIAAEALRFIRKGTHPEAGLSDRIVMRRGSDWSPPPKRSTEAEPPSFESGTECDKAEPKKKTNETPTTTMKKKTTVNRTKRLNEGQKRPYVERVKHAKNGTDSVKWSQITFPLRRRSYRDKMVRAFQVVKTVGYPMLLHNSEWGLSCFYRLAAAYTTDQPLQLAAACLPQLRRAVDVIDREHFQELLAQSSKCQMLLYGVLNCLINWVDHNHKQILLVPGQPNPLPPCKEGDLRCSRCLKNQTFHSSEVKGNPRNIDVEFDFELMTFGSSCCNAPMMNVPLSTTAVNTCTFSEMKQMYSSCVRCKQPIFSEVLVDMETLYSRCTECTFER